MSDVVNADLDRRIRSHNPLSSPSSSTENAEMDRRIRFHRLRTTRFRGTPSPPSSSPDERTSDGTLGLVARTPRTAGRMSTTTVTFTAAQIHQNAVEDAQDYHDERIEELTNTDARTYARTFMHAAMIAHWATLFHDSVSTMLVNF